MTPRYFTIAFQLNLQAYLERLLGNATLRSNLYDAVKYSQSTKTQSIPAYLHYQALKKH